MEKRLADYTEYAHIQLDSPGMPIIPTTADMLKIFISEQVFLW
jgi:hypothetical protein